MQTNVQGAANTFDAVLPGMLARGGGHLVGMASIAGMLGLPEVGAYSASKAALITLLQSLRLDLHSRRIRVTAVCPGFVDTPFLDGHDRRVLRFMMTAAECARRTAQAVERGRAEAYFPWQTWLLARTARSLPFPLLRRLIAALPSARR